MFVIALSYAFFYLFAVPYPSREQAAILIYF